MPYLQKKKTIANMSESISKLKKKDGMSIDEWFHKKALFKIFLIAWFRGKKKWLKVLSVEDLSMIYSLF